ncbi:MAG TPA: ATP-binding protein [Thermoanaerobaculia bacterium]|nr:ATP-binding protein [Thermoanaerobaculia bacterium]
MFGLAVVVTAATAGLAFYSFARKVATFRTAGFTWDRAGDALVVRSVEPESAAQAAGLRPGDRIVLADGRTAGSLEWPEKDLARRPLPHHLVVISGGAISAVALGEPAAKPDYTYIFLAFVGLLYLVIGLFTVVRERAPASRVFWAVCLSSFAIYVITPAGPHDWIWKASWLTEDFFRALLPALLLHLFLIFPKPARSRRLVPLLYVPAAAYMAAELSVLSMSGPSAARATETMTRLWFVYFVLYAGVVIGRLATLVSTRAVPAAEKQARWIALGVTVGLAPFVLLSALPRALGFASPLLSTIAVVPLVFIPLAFAWAILKWRLWDVEIFVREAVAATGAVLIGGMTFVLLNALLDRTLVGMAEAGKNVIAFASGLVLASLLVPVKRRLTDALEKIQYRETYRARRALLEVARDFSAPRPKEELVHAIVRRVEEGLHVVPCSLFLFDNGGAESPEAEFLTARLDPTEVWRLRATAFGELEHPVARHLHAMGYRTFFAMKSGGKLAGALGVGHKDGRVPLSSEDESLLRAVMAQAGLAYENARLYGALADRLEEIRALQQYQESVIQSSSSGIVVLDGADRVHSANPAFAQLVGREEADLVGLPFSDVLPGVEAGPAPADGGERTVEARFSSADETERDLRVSVSLLQGEPDRKVVLVDDVTDRLALERAVAERERLASLGILAAGVAHEVNTPIAGLSSYAQLLLAETPPGDPHYAILKKMERQTFRAAHLVNNLLEFARPRSRGKIRTDLRAVLADAAESVETSFGARKLSIAPVAGTGPVEVLADPREIEQVFVNLLTNARDASPEESVITGDVSRENGMARVTISDRGAGVPAEAGEKLFQPFFTTKKSGGMGLGLAISRDIVRRYGGEIGLVPREGGGTIAWVTLPLATPAAREERLS